MLALIFLLSAGAYAAWVLGNPERQQQKVEIPSSYLETSDTSRFSLQPVLLSRVSKDDSIMLFFPPDKSGSQIYMYDQKNYNRLLFGDHHGMTIPQPYAEGYAAQFGRPVLNLSGFEQGKYYVHVTSCNFGGFFEIQLIDKIR